MSSVVTSKLIEIVYFLIPVALIIGGIIFWENNFAKKVAKETLLPKEKLNTRINELK